MKPKVLAIVKSLLVALIVILFAVTSGFLVSILKIGIPESLYIQAAFIFLPLVVIILFLLIGKIKKEDLSLVINKNGKDYLYLLPVILIFIPVLVQGFKVQDARYLGGCFLLYLFVGIVEEIYFRGLIPSILKKTFSQNQVIWISTLVFGIGHIATSFNGEGPLLTVMTILNALIFGFMAICLLYHTKTIFPLMLIHFLFDFETKIINLNGTGLAIAEGIRGGLMLIYGIILFILLQKKPAVKDEHENQQSI